MSSPTVAILSGLIRTEQSLLIHHHADSPLRSELSQLYFTKPICMLGRKGTGVCRGCESAQRAQQLRFRSG